MGEELVNSPMKLTATIAAQRVLRPRCLLRMSAAYWHVGPARRHGSIESTTSAGARSQVMLLHAGCRKVIQ